MKIITTTTKAQLKQITVLDERFYTFNDRDFYPSATEILSVYPKGFGFDQWQRDVGQNATDIAKRAADTGSKVHQVTEMIDMKQPVNLFDGEREKYSIEEWQMICNYKDFKEQVKPELINTEGSFCSDKLQFGGTIDRVMKINEKIYLIDIKTSNFIHAAHELQVASYAYLWNEVNPDQFIDRTAILWLKAKNRTAKVDHEKGIYQGIYQKGAWQLVTFERHYDESYKIFQHTHAIWKEQNPNPKPLNYVYPVTV